MNRKYSALTMIPLFLWMAFVFSHSFRPAAVSSAQSRWVLEMLRDIIPAELTMGMVRKAAHLIEFAVLGGLAAMLTGRCRKWWECLLMAAALGMAAALCDETIQLFAEGRSGNLADVWLDSFGAAFGALAAIGLRAYRRKPGQMPV